MQKTKRTEEQKSFRAPITVTLGGTEHQIEPLVIKDARAWRGQFAAILSKLPNIANITTDDVGAFEGGVTQLIVSIPDEMADLFFAYAKDLDREKIESEATEMELAEAIEKVMAVAFPLVKGLTGAMTKAVQ